MSDTQILLTEYVKRGSDEAFRQLVQRYVDLVYSTAVRLVGGDTHLAEDVTQTVFLDLAVWAKKLPEEVKLGGWLHRHTCFVASKAVRSERRRQARERQAVEMNALGEGSEANLHQVRPILDEAINQLGDADRAAVLLRFYEKLDFRLVGEALGTSEAAAQKRVSRALDKLESLLRRHGVTCASSALAAVLASEAVKAAPVTLVTSTSAAALAGAASAPITALNLFQLIVSTKLKTGLVAAIVSASLLAPVCVQIRSQIELNQAEGARRRQADALHQAISDNQRLSNRLALAAARQVPDSQWSEVLKLRGEVGVLRRDVRALTAASDPSARAQDQVELMKQTFATRADRLRQWLEANPKQWIPELETVPQEMWLNAVEQPNDTDDFSREARILRANAESRVLSSLMRALRKYA